MRIFLEDKEIQAQEGSKIRDILISQGINPEAVVVKKGGEVAGDFETPKEGDKLQLIRVISGG